MTNGERLEEWGFRIIGCVLTALGAVAVIGWVVVSFMAHWIVGVVSIATVAGFALLSGGMWLQDRPRNRVSDSTKEEA